MTRHEYYTALRQLAREVRAAHGLTTPRVTLTDLRRVYKTHELKITLWKGPLKGIRGSYVNDDLGAEVMVNAKLPDEQRIFTMAHELKHHLVDHVSADSAERVRNDPKEIGAEIFAAELIYPEDDFARDLDDRGIARGACAAEDIVRLKRDTATTLSFTALAKRAEFLGYAPKDSLKGAKWLKLQESMFGLPDYKRIQEYRKRKTGQPTA